MERLSKPSYHAQWNFCLYDDASLIVSRIDEGHARERDTKALTFTPFGCPTLTCVGGPRISQTGIDNRRETSRPV